MNFKDLGVVDVPEAPIIEAIGGEDENRQMGDRGRVSGGSNEDQQWRLCSCIVFALYAQ